MSSPRFTGVYTALVTPFHDDGSLDLERYRELIEDQIAAGIHGLVPCGTTGEAATMSPEEQLETIKACVEQVNGRVPVVAGAGSNATNIAVEMSRKVHELGVDGLLQVTPWYNKPTQDGLYAHFAEVAQATPLPVVLYNVPGRTGIDLQAPTVERLARDFPTIAAVKEATGSVGRAQDILCRLADDRPDFSVLSGEDTFILALLGIGGHGVISVISHVCAKELVEMVEAFGAGKMAEAQRLSRRVTPLQPILFFRSNPVPVKNALHLQGKLPNAHVRLPLVDLNDEDRAELKARLTETGWLS
jgi:4-hydroxy-tetrahydrodipicolinate synthase